MQARHKNGKRAGSGFKSVDMRAGLKARDGNGAAAGVQQLASMSQNLGVGGVNVLHCTKVLHCTVKQCHRGGRGRGGGRSTSLNRRAIPFRRRLLYCLQIQTARIVLSCRADPVPLLASWRRRRQSHSGGGGVEF